MPLTEESVGLLQIIVNIIGGVMAKITLFSFVTSDGVYIRLSSVLFMRSREPLDDLWFAFGCNDKLQTDCSFLIHTSDMTR